MFSMTEMVTPHTPQQPQSRPPAGQTHRLFLAPRVSGWFLVPGRAGKGRGERAPLTSFRRALAFSSGSIRRPAVAFRTTGVRLHASLGIAFLAIFSSCRMVLPPCNGGGATFHHHHHHPKLISDMHAGQVAGRNDSISRKEISGITL